MMLTHRKIQAYFIYVAHFLSFAGYSVFLMILTNYGLMAFSRALTVPLRLLIVGCLLMVAFLSRKIFIHTPAKIFVVFALVYIARIFVELLGTGKAFHQTPIEYLLYFISFGALPFLLISSLRFNASHYNLIRSAILFSSLILSLFTLFYYNKIIGTIGRISQAVTREDNYVSPLALSYCSTLAIGISLSYMMENKVSIRKKVYLIINMVLSLVPFYLGSSRGSIFALFLPFLLIFLCKKNAGKSMRLLMVVAILLVAGVYLSVYFGSNIVDRFTSIQSDIEEGSTSAIRLSLWREGLEQFMNNPFFGNSLEVDKYQFYPHNLFIEVLLSTGLIGFIPFTLLLFRGFKATINIFRNYPQYAWIGVLFLQSFMQNMFSGALYAASWFWLSLGLLFSFEFSLKKQPTIN